MTFFIIGILIGIIFTLLVHELFVFTDEENTWEYIELEDYMLRHEKNCKNNW